MSLHVSGSLMEWLAAHQPEYIDRLAQFVEQGRIEILGGAYFEPILAMIPSWDRVGQIRSYTRFLQSRLGATVRGVWVPERVWEQSFVRDLVDAGIEYTVLDDFHFKCAGLTESQLTGHLLTEDEGRVLSVFPGSERLRYTIPFADPQQTIDYLAQDRRGARQRGGRLRRRRREVRHLAGDEKARLRRRLAGPLLRRPGAKPGVDPSDHAGRGVRQRSAGGQNLPARLQLSRNDRMGAADRAAGRVRADRPRDEGRPALGVVAAVHPRRILAEFQGEISRGRRNVLPHDERQPPLAGDRRGDDLGRTGQSRVARTGPRRTVSRPVQLRLLARGVRRHLSAPSPQRRLSAPDRRRQPARPGHRQAGDLDRGRGRRLQFRRPAGSPPDKRQDDGPGHARTAAGR